MHHRKCYGLVASKLLIEHVKTRPHDSALHTSIAEQAPLLLAFYGQVGFVATDNVSDNERVLWLEL